MNLVVYSGLTLFACIAIVSKYRWQSLYVLTVVAYVQNFVLAYLYTNHLAGRDLLWNAILTKEILLLVTFLYSFRILLWHSPTGLPRPFVILAAFTLYCLIRIGLGIVFSHDGLNDSVRMLRMTCFPLEVVCVALAITLTQPNFVDRYLKKACLLVVVLALVGIYLAFFSGRDFWANNVNIASYNIDVKGDDPFYVAEDLGVSATALGREQFLDLIPFRAMGTFGDPLAMGFALVVPILLLTFYFDRKLWSWVSLGILGVALFLTFSRSAWILLYITCLYVLLRKKRLIWAAMALLVPLFVIVSIRSLADFALEDFALLSWTSPGGEHAEGIVWFYRRGLTDAGNFFGKGMSPDVQKIPESGYAFLLEHLGLFAYIGFLWFLFSLFRWLGRQVKVRSSLPLISQGIVVATLIVMHFSQYPFAFIEWLMLWLLLGVSMGCVWRNQRTVRRSRALKNYHLFGLGAQGEGPSEVGERIP